MVKLSFTSALSTSHLLLDATERSCRSNEVMLGVYLSHEGFARSHYSVRMYQAARLQDGSLVTPFGAYSVGHHGMTRLVLCVAASEQWP